MRDAELFEKWALGEGPLPPLKSGPALLAACRKVLARLKKARNLIVEDQSWEAFELFQGNCAVMRELLTLHVATNVHLPPTERKEIAIKVETLERTFVRFMASSARHPMINTLRGWARRKTNPLEKAAKDLVIATIDDLVAHRDSRYLDKKDPTETLTKQWFRRNNNARIARERSPYIIPRDQVALLPVNLRRECRAFAASVGVAGYAVPPNRALGNEIGSYFTDPSARCMVEAYLKQHRETDETTTTMIDLRTTLARKDSFSSFAHKQLFGAAVSSPRRAIGALAAALEHMGPAYTKLHNVVSRKMARMGFDEACEMDVRHMLRNVFDHRVSECKDAFPTKATLAIAIPELVKCGGWKASSPRIITNANSPGWVWSLTASDGRCAELAVFPTVMSDDLAEADHTPVRGVLGVNGPQRGLSVINLYVEHRGKYLTIEDLAAVAHEVGHALHALVSPPNALVDPVAAPGADIVEFPSQLLELYPRDPRVLARWARADRNPEYKKPSYWYKVLSAQYYNLPQNLRDMLVSWCDLTLHATPYRNPEVGKYYARALSRFGLPKNYAAELPYLSFSWDQYAGCYFTYPVGAACAMHLGMIQSFDASPDCREIARTFRSLHDNVLSKAKDVYSFRKLMEQWTGFDFNELMRRAMEGHGRAVAAQYRAAAQVIAASGN